MNQPYPHSDLQPTSGFHLRHPLLGEEAAHDFLPFLLLLFFFCRCFALDVDIYSRGWSMVFWVLRSLLSSQSSFVVVFWLFIFFRHGFGCSFFFVTVLFVFFLCSPKNIPVFRICLPSLFHLFIHELSLPLCLLL